MDMVEAFLAICLFRAADSPSPQSSNRIATATDRKLAEAWLAERRRIMNANPTKDQSREVRDRWIAAKSGDVLPPPLEFPLAVGSTGTLSGGIFRLVHRLGNSEGRVAIQKPSKGRVVVRPTRGKQRKPPEEVVLLRAFNVSGIAEGHECQAAGCFTVTKMETYTMSSGGSRTLYVIEPYDSSVAERMFRHAVKEELAGQSD
jgi:hypothetical protein